ncbi:NADP-dependent oxidoreductase domain,Aldo/keto reductase [Cinara cedri]|uniref:NADP-dependent oxidoreductase domain,Aldo/keto reductase n=1 Tax=Cinara cedri TaxID=506608 RepID=A0A5E4MMD1_9HEMI|nr:NADP-dependent oxidoreductase domain,Aldo/keto reductase [Cinara cedri]
MLPVSKTFLPLNTHGGSNKIPIIGFGTYTIYDRKNILDVLDVALGAGYRLIDTAAVYRNEEYIKEALAVLLPKYHLKREDLFITSKLAPRDYGDEKQVTAAVQSSLDNLGTNYLDLYLIHWPGASHIDAKSPENSKLRNLAWKALMKLHDNGKGPLKNIGVSNYTARHLKEMLADPFNIVPAVNQIEFHPYFQQSSEFHDICQKAQIVLQAYCSLGGFAGKRLLLNDKVIKRIAKKHSIYPAQVLLRWAIQRNYAIIPKSITPERIKINFDVDIELSKDDLNDINNIKHVEKFGWDPQFIA